MGKKSKGNRVKSWAKLKEVSRRINIGGEDHYFVPEGIYALKDTKVILDDCDEIIQELDFYEKNKWSQKESIILIGTTY